MASGNYSTSGSIKQNPDSNADGNRATEVLCSSKSDDNIVPDSILPILEPLISELHRFKTTSEGIRFEKLEQLMIRLMKSCHSGKDFVLQVSKYLTSNYSVLDDLSFLAETALTGQIISHGACSCLTLMFEILRLLTDNNHLFTLKAANAGFILIIFHTLEILSKAVQYNKILGLLRSSIFGLIQNFAVDPSCWPHFQPTDFVDILKMYTKISDGGICFMSLYTLSLLAEIIPINKQDVLCFEERDLREYVNILITAVSSSNLEARKVFGSLVIPADDILRLLKQILYIQSNRMKMGSFLLSLISPIEVCLQTGNKIQQLAAMDLLWTLASEPEFLPQLKVNLDLALLEHLQESVSDVSGRVGVMTLCVLYKLCPEVIKNDSSMIEVIQGTYNFKRYAESVDLCNQVLASTSEHDFPMKNVSLLYRGKSFYHLYRKEQSHFQEVSSTLPRKEFYLRQRNIYEKAGEVINNLGSLLDTNSKSFVDDEMLLFLDISMIDVAIQVNNLKEYSRCLLCLKRAKLRKSHLCPDSIIRAFASGLENTKNKRIFNLSFFKEGKTISPHGITMWLFCEKCEIILSRDGETHFIPKFFKRIYNTECPQQPKNELRILYDQWLYRFSIGLLFRGLINEAFASFSNSDKIHCIFTKMRELICFEGVLSDLPHAPDIYMLISPSVPNISTGFIGHIYHAPFLFALTDIHLKTGLSITPRACQFFLARIGIFNFLLPLDDKVKEFLPVESLINVSGDEFVVAPEIERASIIPKGITKILEGLAAATQKNLLESSVTTLQGLKLSDATSPPAQQAATYMARDAMSDDMKKLNELLLTSHSLNSPQELDLLPPGFHIDHSNGDVSLPEGHQILFHGNFEIEMERSELFHNITFLLAAGNDHSTSFTLEKPYVIFHRHQPGLMITLAFFINPDTFSALTFLPDPNPKVMLHQIGNQLKIKYFTKTLLPELMELRGLKSYHSVVHRDALQRPSSNFSYDHVCAKRCWYCTLRCNTCLSQTSVDLNTKLEGRTQRFCSKVCQDVYYSATSKEDVVLDAFDSLSHHLLLLSFDITLPRKSGDYSRADVSVYLCKNTGLDVFPEDSLYLVYHHTTVVDQHFLEYFIQDDGSFSHMLHYYREKEYPEMMYAVDFAATVLSEKLQDLGTNLRTLSEFVVNNLI